jgi:hypothetical protein
MASGFSPVNVVVRFQVAAETPMTWLRSIGAVVAGMVAIVMLHTGTDVALEASGIFPPPETPHALDATFLGIATVYRNVYNVFAGWLTARLAPQAPVAHAIALGAIGLAANLAGAVAMWHLGAHWYPVLLTVLALPASWLGGAIAAKRLKIA